MAEIKQLPRKPRHCSSSAADEYTATSEEKKLDRSLSENDVDADESQSAVRLDIFFKPALKSPPSISESPIKPAPATVRCKLAEERRKSLELEVVQKRKEHDEKIQIAQKIKQESDEQRKKALRDQFEKKSKTSEELLAIQKEEYSKKVAANSKRLEEARKLHDENIAAKVKDAEQKLAKTAISEEIREKQIQKIVEKQQDNFRKIQEAKEKAEQHEREINEQKRKEIEQKEMMAQKKREDLIETRKGNLHKQHIHIDEVLAGKKREKQTQG